MEKKELSIDVGMRVRTLREKKHWSREMLAEQADISIQYLSDIESGKKNMTIFTFYKLIRALNTSADYLLFHSENNEDSALTIELRSLSEIDRMRASMILKSYIEGLSLK